VEYGNEFCHASRGSQEFVMTLRTRKPCPTTTVPTPHHKLPYLAFMSSHIFNHSCFSRWSRSGALPSGPELRGDLNWSKTSINIGPHCNPQSHLICKSSTPQARLMQPSGLPFCGFVQIGTSVASVHPKAESATHMSADREAVQRAAWP
jgi:hypothetical protein